MRCPISAFLPFLALSLVVPAVRADEPGTQSVAETAAQLRKLESRVIVLGTVRQSPLASMLARDVEARLRAANRVDRRAWDEIKTRAEWEGFRDERLKALRASLGTFPPPPEDFPRRTTRTIAGDGYRVENLVYQSRPGLLVTANLYRPAKAGASLPGIILCHSHQSTKHTGWRQDMAMTWARAGCVVLVPDHLGHGERRQHPFGGEGPHDYHFRFDAGIQLHLVGESLMGWLAWDLMRGVDLLLAQKEVDPKRILLLSEPAGGGDVAAVTAALDPRITGVMVQNFGGPQPETAYPLPKDAEESFHFAGSGSWESTRNLRLSARDGFLPWAIVATAAPRRLIYDHEFYWDEGQDPVWKRLERVYGFYDAAGSVTGIAGRGFVVGSAPENSHWLQVNREVLYPVLERWFAIPDPKQEYSRRLPEKDLLCLTPEVSRELDARPLHVLAARLAEQRIEFAREARARRATGRMRHELRREWARLLGETEPAAAVIASPTLPAEKLGAATVERIHLRTEPGIVVPVLLLLPPRAKDVRLPVVIAVAQQGKQEFLLQRSEPIAELLAAGVAVCLPDVRGTGETSPGDDRDRRSAATSISASEWMLGQSLLGGRLRDLRSVLAHLRTRPELDGKWIALWGDSFAKVNPPDANFQVPYTAGDRPALSEPLGGLLALLGALYDDEIQAAYVQGGLSDFRSVLDGPFCYVPHDVVVPGVLAVGDLCDVAAAVAPLHLRLAGMVDGLNRPVSEEELARRNELARREYTGFRQSNRLQLGGKPPAMKSIAPWLIASLNPADPAPPAKESP